MATSGVSTYSVTELDIITDALETIGVAGPGESISAEDIVTARRKLNMILKQWVSQIDFAPGLKMWKRKRAYLFPQKSQVAYNLGPTGDHATESYTQTTLSASAATSAGTVTLTSVTGLSSGDYIGIVLDTGSVHWTTVNGAPAGSVATLTTVMPSSASSGNVVFFYTTKISRPFEILTAVRRDVDGYDTPISVDMSMQDYEAIYEKTYESTIDNLYFEAQRTNAVLYTNFAPSDVTEIIRFTYNSYIEDLTATTQDVEITQEWFRPLSAQLAFDLCAPFRVVPPPSLVEVLNSSLAMAKRAYPETSTAYYQSDPDDY